MKHTSVFTHVRALFAPIIKIADCCIFEPIRYGIGKYYHAEKYWHDRFKKFGMSLQASGNRQKTEEENENFYRATTQSFLSIIEQERIVLSESRILDIGCGTGYYTRFCNQQGAVDYTGLDVTDILFPELQRIYPDYRFVKQDLTRGLIRGLYDCILMFDVIEHITDTASLAYAMHSILNVLSETGVFILAPIMDKPSIKLSYVRYWTMHELEPLLAGYRITTSMPFPDGTIIAVRR